MSIISRIRKQKAVYWAPGIPDGFGGYKTFPTATEIDCRWSQKIVRAQTASGDEKQYDAVIFTENLLSEKGFIYLGLLSALPRDHADPQKLTDVYQIDFTENIPNLRATEFLRKAYLVGRK